VKNRKKNWNMHPKNNLLQKESIIFASSENPTHSKIKVTTKLDQD
jgi:hypothetical protein